MCGNGFYKLKHSGPGITGVRGVGVRMQSCFAMGIRVSERHLSGIKNYSQDMEERGPVLTTRGMSLLVVDKLCDQARGKHSPVTCFC